MTPLTTFLTALDALNSNKLRSGLTLLGIIIGVTAVIALTAIGNGAQETITARIQSLGTNLLFVRPGASTSAFGFAGAAGSAATLTLEDSEALMDPALASHVVDVAPETSTRSQVVFERENTNTTVVGVTPSYLPVRAYELATAGRSRTQTSRGGRRWRCWRQRRRRSCSDCVTRWVTRSRLEGVRSRSSAC